MKSLTQIKWFNPSNKLKDLPSKPAQSRDLTINLSTPSSPALLLFYIALHLVLAFVRLLEAQLNLTPWLTKTPRFTEWQDQKALQRVVKATTGTQLPAIKAIYHKHCLHRGLSISRDPTYPNCGLFSPLPSGRRYRRPRALTTRLRNRFFPLAVTHLNLATNLSLTHTHTQTPLNPFKMSPPNPINTHSHTHFSPCS